MVEMAGHKVDLKEFVNDVMAGMSVDELMKKHHVDRTELMRAYRQLNKRESIALMSLARRKLLTDSQFFRAFREVQDSIDELD
jgi:hypothetical protein